ncbi:sigma-70 family RNA polymerase sigma factor [Pedobacter frigidisoli]|uniref:sigma-70 family RNA polymerase sigma factor n=1 Tax=Pedobacter frigidisoli TaxID=2530455 RepID=UPI00292CD195|nr:sigma-70 family RNA polymerase sigma factor [Pedobacter frigidisoli]
METLIKTEPQKSQEDLSRQIELLYKRWASILKNYANYYLNDNEASSSIVNDIFIKLWNTDQEILNPKAYLFRSVKNASFNHLGGQHKKTVSYLDTEELTLLSDELQPPGFATEDHPQQLFLQNLIQKLPEKRRLVFKMHRIEGLNYAEIAELLQISTRTVEDHLAKSMKFIHENCQHFFNG